MTWSLLERKTYSRNTVEDESRSSKNQLVKKPIQLDLLVVAVRVQVSILDGVAKYDAVCK